MAPVGCWESLAAAIQAGADSVYFGIEHLNMRARSSVNFTTADLHQIAATCKKAGVRTYLTVNTVMYPEDLPLMRKIVDNACDAGVDAIIASDISVMQYCNRKEMEVHLSTQLNTANTEALRFYAQFADVVVLARELNMQQVANIHRDIIEQDICGRKGEPVRIEMFCHGALCMAVSGKCYLSLNNLGMSANRGACAQICRRGYIVKDRESDLELEVDNQYIMSPKDLKTIRFLDKMLDAGVRVLKIEGRARGPEYVKTVVECYKEAVNTYVQGKWKQITEEKFTKWDERLAQVFNRGFWDGWYQGQTLGEWNDSHGNKATRRKVYAGHCTNYFHKPQVAEFLIEAHVVKEGDELLITGETTGAYECAANHIRVFENDKTQAERTGVTEAPQGTLLCIKTDSVIRRGDKLYIWDCLE